MFETDHAGVLEPGSLFRLQDRPEGRWGVYRVTRCLPDQIEAYGGSPDPKGQRQWRAFYPDKVKRGARKVRTFGQTRHGKRA